MSSELEKSLKRNAAMNTATAVRIAEMAAADEARRPEVLEYARNDKVNTKIARDALEGEMIQFVRTMIPTIVWAGFMFLELFAEFLTESVFDNIITAFVIPLTVALIATLIVGIKYLPRVSGYKRYALWYFTVMEIYGEITPEHSKYVDLRVHNSKYSKEYKKSRIKEAIWTILVFTAWIPIYGIAFKTDSKFMYFIMVVVIGFCIIMAFIQGERSNSIRIDAEKEYVETYENLNV